MFRILPFSFDTKSNTANLSFSGKEQQLKKVVLNSTLPADCFQKTKAKGNVYEPYKEIIIYMADAGKLIKEIAYEINKSEPFIYSALRFFGIKVQHKGKVYEPYKEQIAKMVSEGSSNKEIAEAIGKDAAFVNNAKVHFGLTHQRGGKGCIYLPYKEQITQMVMEGKSNKEIAKSIGKDFNFVNSAKVSLGLTHPRCEKGHTYKPYKEQITQMVNEGKTAKEIAEVIGKNDRFVGSAKMYFGLTHPHSQMGDIYKPYKEIITQMVNEGKTAKEIAEVISKDQKFVANAKMYLGLTHIKAKKGNVYKPYKEQITQMVSEGKTSKEIAEEIGKNDRFVGSAKAYFGLTHPHAQKGETYNSYAETITQMVREGKTAREIAEKIGKDEKFVANAKSRLGLTQPKTEKGNAYNPYREIITQMVSEGKTANEIAEKIGKDERFVTNAKTFFGLTKKKKS